MTEVLTLILAYLAGSIPFGLLIGFARGVDIRAHGSKNIGATNAGRVLGRPWGVLAFVLDFLKGVGPVLGAGVWLGAIRSDAGDAPPSAHWWWIGVAIAAILGHVFPIWLKFKGGKGVATGFGAMLGLWPIVTWPALLALGVWLVVARVTRYVSAASIAAALALPAGVVAFSAAGLTGAGPDAPSRLASVWPFAACTAGMAVLVVWRHRANIARLRDGRENRIGGPGALSGG